MSDTPEASGAWTKIGEGGFSPLTTGITQTHLEILTFDNVTKSRYFRMNFLDGRSGANPYVNVVSLHMYYN